MKLEQAEAHFDDLDLSAMAPGGADHFTAADVNSRPADVIGKVCSIYQKVKPFLALMSDLFFVPKKWRDSLKAYMALMDQICPGS